MKRILSCILLFSLLIVALTSCFPLPEPTPADFANDSQPVIDNETPYVYVQITKNEEAYLDDTLTEMFWGDCPYSYLTERHGNKIIRHYSNGEKDLYYTVFSLTNNQLYYIFLTPDGNGDYLMEHYLVADIRYDHSLQDWIYAHDHPSKIIGNALPDFCYKEYYSFEEIEKEFTAKWKYYDRLCYEADLESYLEYRSTRDENGKPIVTAFYRTLQAITFDVFYKKDGMKIANSGLYCYDILFYANGGGTLHYRHFIYGAGQKYTVDQDVTVELTAEEILNLQSVMKSNDFDNIPTWNPEEFDGFDGETTYIFASRSGSPSEHLISMWESTPNYGIYQIRTAIEELVRQRIEVTSGSVYVDYNNIVG